MAAGDRLRERGRLGEWWVWEADWFSVPLGVDVIEHALWYLHKCKQMALRLWGK
jgi:predicted solute-binding protein